MAPPHSLSSPAEKPSRSADHRARPPDGQVNAHVVGSVRVRAAIARPTTFRLCRSTTVEILWNAVGPYSTESMFDSTSQVTAVLRAQRRRCSHSAEPTDRASPPQPGR